MYSNVVHIGLLVTCFCFLLDMLVCKQWLTVKELCRRSGRFLAGRVCCHCGDRVRCEHLWLTATRLCICHTDAGQSYEMKLKRLKEGNDQDEQLLKVLYVNCCQLLTLSFICRLCAFLQWLWIFACIYLCTTFFYPTFFIELLCVWLNGLEDIWIRFLRGQMPFLLLSCQCQSTEWVLSVYLMYTTSFKHTSHHELSFPQACTFSAYLTCLLIFISMPSATAVLPRGIPFLPPLSIAHPYTFSSIIHVIPQLTDN